MSYLIPKAADMLAEFGVITSANNGVLLQVQGNPEHLPCHKHIQVVRIGLWLIVNDLRQFLQVIQKVLILLLDFQMLLQILSDILVQTAEHLVGLRQVG